MVLKRLSIVALAAVALGASAGLSQGETMVFSTYTPGQNPGDYNASQTAHVTSETFFFDYTGMGWSQPGPATKTLVLTFNVQLPDSIITPADYDQNRTRDIARPVNLILPVLVTNPGLNRGPTLPPDIYFNLIMPSHTLTNVGVPTSASGRLIGDQFGTTGQIFEYTIPFVGRYVEGGWKLEVSLRSGASNTQGSTDMDIALIDSGLDPAGTSFTRKNYYGQTEATFDFLPALHFTGESYNPAVPEPSSLVLLGAGGLMLLRRRRQPS